MACRRTVAVLIASGICLFPDSALAQAPADSALSSTRLFFGPTSRVLAPGEYTLNLFMIMPTMQVGITPRLTVAGGIFPFGGYPRLLSAKYQRHRTDDHSVAGGIIEVFQPQGRRVGAVYITTTRERANRAWTFGGGVARRTGDYALLGAFGSSFLQFGAEKRLDKDLVFVSENYVGRDFRMFSVGIRFMRDRETKDFNILFIKGTQGAVVIPTIVFSIGSRPDR